MILIFSGMPKRSSSIGEASRNVYRWSNFRELKIFFSIYKFRGCFDIICKRFIFLNNGGGWRYLGRRISFITFEVDNRLILFIIIRSIKNRGNYWSFGRCGRFILILRKVLIDGTMKTVMLNNVFPSSFTKNMCWIFEWTLFSMCRGLGC
jgi:hypothetical protein